MAYISKLTKTTNNSATDYPSYCSLFLERTQTLVSDVAQRHGQIVNAYMFSRHYLGDSPEQQKLILKNTLKQMSYVFGETAYPLKNFGLAMASAAIPLARAKEFFADRKADLIVTTANSRAGFLSREFGSEAVADMLPRSLRTPEAASYMHLRQHHDLHQAIGASLMFVQ